MRLGDSLSSALREQLQAATNPSLVPQKMAEPEKGNDLAVDLKWVNYHIEYINDILRIFKMTLSRGSSNSMFFVPNSIIATPAYLGSSRKADDYYLGWHVNSSIFRVPSLFIEGKAVTHIRDTIAIEKKVNPGYIEMVDILSHCIFNDPAIIRKMADLEIPNSKILSNDTPSFGDGSWINPDANSTLIRDYRTTKLGAANKNHPYSSMVLIDGKKVFHGIPLMPVGLSDDIVDMMEGDLLFGKAPWNYLV